LTEETTRLESSLLSAEIVNFLKLKIFKNEIATDWNRSCFTSLKTLQF